MARSSSSTRITIGKGSTAVAMKSIMDELGLEKALTPAALEKIEDKVAKEVAKDIAKQFAKAPYPGENDTGVDVYRGKPGTKYIRVTGKAAPYIEYGAGTEWRGGAPSYPGPLPSGISPRGTTITKGWPVRRGPGEARVDGNGLWIYKGPEGTGRSEPLYRERTTRDKTYTDKEAKKLLADPNNKAGLRTAFNKHTGEEYLVDNKGREFYPSDDEADAWQAYGDTFTEEVPGYRVTGGNPAAAIVYNSKPVLKARLTEELKKALNKRNKR